MSGYEFSNEDNVILTELVVQMRRFSLTVIASGIVLLASALVGIAYMDVGYNALTNGVLIVDALLVGLLGWVWYRPVNEFNDIISTTGMDIDLLLKGLTELHNGFLWIALLTTIDLGLLILRIASTFAS